MKSLILILDFDFFFSYHTPSINKLVWGLSWCHIQNLTSSLLLCWHFGTNHGQPLALCRTGLYHPALQPLITWAARSTLLKGTPAHFSPLLQTSHGLPMLPTMKTRRWQWFVSSVHVLLLDYLFEVTSSYIAVACLASVVPANLLFLNTVGTFQSHCLCCFHCWEYSSDIFIRLSLTSCKCLLIYHLHNCI